MKRGRCLDLHEKAVRNPKGMRFSELCRLCECAGLTLVRQKGSHRIYQKEDEPRFAVPIQEDKAGMAKAYQVRQVLDLIDEHELSLGVE